MIVEPHICTTLTLSVRDIYPNGIEVPPGYEYEAFRVPLTGEKYLGTLGEFREVIVCKVPIQWPRVIVRLKPCRIVLEEVDGPFTLGCHVGDSVNVFLNDELIGYKYRVVETNGK